ncbi:hypothetical protein [Roseibacillus ishigakijimensis]|uniref:hypothetical protein n=1 Tax=Roseibacillus ishigakijimensis TaxID=454146 RepID=UPI00367026BB
MGESFRIQLPVDLNKLSGPYREGTIGVDPAVSFTIRLERDGRDLPISRAQGSDLLANAKAADVLWLELQVGNDLDGDGLPDSWEQSQMYLAGILDWDLTRITPEGDLDGDGMSNREEYIAGTFAYLFSDAIHLEIDEIHESGWAELSFLSVIDKMYQLECSADGVNWHPVAFSTNGEAGLLAETLRAQDTSYQTLHVPPPLDDTHQFFRIVVY